MANCIMSSYPIVASLLFILLQIGQVVTLPNTVVQTSVHNCHSQNQKQFKMTCGDGHMIRIKRVFYGYSLTHACFHTPGDCIVEEKSYYPCVGWQRCEINAPQVAGRFIKSCQKASNYFQVDYECVPVGLTKDICKQGELTDKSGFLKSPDYPLRPDQPRLCTTKISAPPGYNIRLHIIDLDLREDGTEACRDSLSVRQLSGVTLCARRANEDIDLTPLNTMTISYQASAGKGNKGFWLYYEAYNTKPITTIPSPLATHETRVVKTETGADNSDITEKVVESSNDKSRTISIPNDSVRNKEEIPFAAIIGGVIGSLLLVLTVLVALLLIKWWREQCAFRDRTKKKFREVRNNAYHSSNDLFPPVHMEV